MTFPFLKLVLISCFSSVFLFSSLHTFECSFFTNDIEETSPRKLLHERWEHKWCSTNSYCFVSIPQRAVHSVCLHPEGPGQHPSPDPHTSIPAKRHLRLGMSSVLLKIHDPVGAQTAISAASTAFPLSTGENLAQNGLRTTHMPNEMHRASHPVT